MAEESAVRTTHALLLQNHLETPLGCLRLAGCITKGRGVETSPEMRVYGRYAVVCILRGSGNYADVQGTRCKVRAGEAMLVFPELGHRYRPRSGESWDELYLTFDGPVFDLWRQTGLLSTRHPVFPFPNTTWLTRLQALVENGGLLTSAEGRLSQLNQFLLLLGELVHRAEPLPEGAPYPEWAVQAQALLDLNLGAEVAMEEIASTVGMSYETFRKRFLQITGVTPTRYRLQRRIAAAGELLRYSPQLTNRQAAEILGFADEFHFSRRFTQVMGTTPRTFRQSR